MTYDELVAHARKLNKYALGPAFDPCETSYVVELINRLNTLPADGYVGQPTGQIIDSVHAGIAVAVEDYTHDSSFYNDGEHRMEYLLVTYTEYDNGFEVETKFREELDPTEPFAEFPSIYDLACVYKVADGDRTCYMVRSDEEGCAVWIVFTVEPKGK